MIINPEECGGPCEVILGSDVGSRPVMLGGKIRDDYGNPPGTINYVEPDLDCSELEKTIILNVMQVLRVGDNLKYLTYRLRNYFNRFSKPHTIILGKFKFVRENVLCAYIYDETEPKLCEKILSIYIQKDNEVKINYRSGIWDKQFLKTITEFSQNNRTKSENEKKIKEERIQKMFAEEGEE